MISFKSVQYKIKNKIILSSITMNIKNGEKVLLVGKSGSGKSTIFNLLLKNITPTSGNIFYKKENIRDFNESKIQAYRKEEISVIYQKDDLYDNKTVYENLIMFYKENSVIKMINKASLSHLLYRKVSELSGGERQRVNIIKSTLSPFNILLCDEITSALDEENATKIINFILDLFKNKTIIFISHNKDILTNKIDKIIELENSKIKKIETINEIIPCKESKINTDNLKSLYSISFYNGLKKINFSSLINYIILLFSIIISVSFTDIAHYFAKQSYQEYFDYDVVMIKDNNFITNDNINILSDLSSLFINSELTINNNKLYNINFLPFNNKNNYTPIVINNLLLKRNNINKIENLSIKGKINYSSNNINLIDENKMFSSASIYYDIKYFSKIYEIESNDLIIINYDISIENTLFTNNPLYEEKKENKPYLDSNAYKDYLTFKLIFTSIEEIVDYFFVLILIFSILSTILINATSIIKDIKQIAIYISRGYKNQEILFSYLLPTSIYFTASLLLCKHIKLHLLMLPLLINILTITLCYLFIIKRNVHDNLKEDLLC